MRDRTAVSKATGATIRLAATILLAAACGMARAESAPPPTGKLVDLGGHRLHVRCTGAGGPTVVVENGLGDFSFDWVLVQERVSKFARICTYDRAGYAWSDPGPMPRTFAQINRELKDALSALREPGPYVLVGQSYGGPVARSFAATYPEDVAGMVLADSVFEDQRITIRGKAVRLRDGARGRPIPPPREAMTESDRPGPPARTGADPSAGASDSARLEPLYDRLPSAERALHLWAQALPGIRDAEDSQRDWSSESLERMHASPQDGTLGAIPLIVLTRAAGGYGNGADVPGAVLEEERKNGQARLARLSSNGTQIIVASGHNMHLEAPDDVAGAIRRVVEAARAAKRGATAERRP